MWRIYKWNPVTIKWWSGEWRVNPDDSAPCASLCSEFWCSKSKPTEFRLEMNSDVYSRWLSRQANIPISLYIETWDLESIANKSWLLLAQKNRSHNPCNYPLPLFVLLATHHSFWHSLIRRSSLANDLSSLSGEMKQVLAPIIALVIGIGTLAFMAISPQVCHGAAGGSATVARSIFVSKKGSGADFTRIQDAINSVPFANRRWIRIHIAAGVYK